MNRYGHAVLPLLLSICFIVVFLTACSGNGRDIGCPFTALSWDASAEDVMEEEGSDYETYDSIYKGLTYTYQKDYLGYTGTIKYMFDPEGALCNVSWSYAAEDADSVLTVYRDVCDDTVKRLGPGTSDDGVGNYCEMWISDKGTVMANAVITNDTHVMQIAYMSAEVSKQGK